MTILCDIIIKSWKATELVLRSLDIFDEVVFRLWRSVPFFLLFESLVDSLDVFQVVHSFLPPWALTHRSESKYFICSPCHSVLLFSSPHAMENRFADCICWNRWLHMLQHLSIADRVYKIPHQIWIWLCCAYKNLPSSALWYPCTMHGRRYRTRYVRCWTRRSQTTNWYWSMMVLVIIP